MTFNLSGPPTTDDIRVGYIDPTLGYVDGVTICEANSYAQNNPGTVFIFTDGNNSIKYLNINEVNKLTPDDLLSTKDECGGIQNYVECGPPVVQISGGGGIGAVGNPVVGADGAILAIDIVSGGNGYQYPPYVTANDACQNGSGAVFTAVLGETVDQLEVYDGEEDFEEYQICEGDAESYGLMYGLDGEELGPWDPNSYTDITEDPIKQEIEAFQKALEYPFWTTRDSLPDRITALDIEYATQDTTNVTFSQWGEFMNTYAVSPIKPSDTRGTDEAGKVFKMEWEYNFPITGEYIFRGVCDDTGQVYIDDALVGNLGTFNQNPTPLQKTIQEGNHIIRIDLLNTPATETQTQTITSSSSIKAKFIQKGSSFYLQVDGTGSGEIDFVMEVNDSPIIAGLAANEVRIPSDNGKVKFVRTQGLPSVNAKNQTIGQPTLVEGSYLEEEIIKKSGNFTAGNLYGPIEIIGAGVGAKGPIINSSSRLGIRDADGDDENIKITIDDKKGNKTTSTIEVGEVISPKSWNENPVGVSLLIEAPTPPVPQEQLPPAIGECPPNPIWTTRFPGSDQTWYPVRNQIWTDFFNRYAISPILPLDTPGTDGTGVTYKNSWQIEIPYRGYYAFQAQRDNTAKIYVDGVLAFDVLTSGDAKWVESGLINQVKTQKIFLEPGLRTISVELQNTPENVNSVIDQKIFSTQDWRVGGPQETSSNLTAKFIQQGSSFYLQVDGTGSAEISFIMEVNDASYIAGLAAKEVRIPSDSGKVKFVRQGTTGAFGEGGLFEGNTLGVPTEETIKESGTFTGGKKYGPIEIIGADLGARGPIINSSSRLGIRDADGDDENIKINIDKIKNSTSSLPATSQSPTKNGVTYSGPSLIGYSDKRWSTFMNDFSVSPSNVNSPGVFTLIWSGVNFPYSGTYKFNLQADNSAKLKIGGVDIIEIADFIGEKVQYTFNLTAGNYDVEVTLDNVTPPDTSTEDNPTGVALYISKDVVLSDNNKASWVQNPMGISAILIPPPCSKLIGGKGVVDEIIVEDPGNGYLPTETPGTGYPVTLILDKVIVDNPGINYSCGEDQLQIVPNNGVQLSYKCGSFGQITEVIVQNPGSPFNVYPSITLPSTTGVNASFKPVFKVVRDPILPPGQQQVLIQVTDLVGLKQTGYVDGRAYYGAVYYDQGISYAGYYKTAGTQTRVYATLQESITAKVTTPPSAIQRSGTDITSNDPLLNIPGTIQSTTEQ